MPAVLEPASSASTNRESGWVNRLFNREESTPEYQELKFTLHRKLLDPDQSGSALLYGRRPCTQGSAHSSRQAGG
jgi:hypothetical protein